MYDSNNSFARTVHANLGAFRWDGLAYKSTDSVVPEPTTFIVWSMIGLSAVGITRRRNSKA